MIQIKLGKNGRRNKLQVLVLDQNQLIKTKLIISKIKLKRLDLRWRKNEDRRLIQKSSRKVKVKRSN